MKDVKLNDKNSDIGINQSNSVIGITLLMAQSDPIKRRPLYKDFKILFDLPKHKKRHELIKHFLKDKLPF